MRTSSMGRFKRLLFATISFALLGVEPKAYASFTPANDTLSGAPAGMIGTSGNSPASTAFTDHSSNQSLIMHYAALSKPKPVIATGTDSLIVAPHLDNRAHDTFAVAIQNHNATSATSSAGNGAMSASSGPLIFYTDVHSGPNSGGERNNGTYLTIFGTHFGTTQGTSTVTINGRTVAQYLLWSDTKIGVQVGHVSSGPIVVSVGNLASNSNNTFTVRPGHTYYIGPSIDHSAPESCSALISANSYSNPWGLTNYASTTESNYDYSKMRTPYTYYKCMSPGDTLVFLNGVSFPYFDGRGWHASLTLDTPGETPTSFMTFMARPGAKVQLGGEGWANVGIRNTGSSTYSIYSGLTLVGSGPNGGGLNADPYDRFVGNTIMCPDCSGPAGALTGGNNNEALGNLLYDISTDTGKLPEGSNKTYHAAYFTGNNFEFAWNRIYNTAAYNGFQINEDGVSGFYNFSIHDNDIAYVNGSGINLSTIDPASGYINVFNNIIHHVGLNQANDGGGDDPHSCIAVKGYGRATAPGTVEIYNNTMYDCSSYLNLNRSSNASCAILVFANQLNVTTNLVNNIVYQLAYAGTARQNVYLCGGGSIGTLSGSNNLWYHERTPGTTAPATRYGAVANPRFVSATDYHLQNGSPALGACIAFGSLARDFDGALRQKRPTIGAYEYSKNTRAALPPSSRIATASNVPAQLFMHKRAVFLTIALFSLILIFIGGVVLRPLRRRSWSQT